MGRTAPAEVIPEATRLKALEGDRILRVHDVDVVDAGDFAFLATELALGSTEDELERLGGVGVRPDLVVTWIRQALSGLEACHVHGFIHRDIKPANVFLQSPEWAQLGDFGAAALMDHLGTVGSGGDPLVRAPEMLKGGRIDVRADIYSLGVTLYRLLTGEWPVEEPGSWADLKRRVSTADYVDIRGMAPHVPLALALIVRKAMALRAEDRYSSAQDMQHQLAKLALRSVWQPSVPRPNTREWIQAAGPSDTLHRVSVTMDGSSFNIETRRAKGAGTRVVALCSSGIKRAVLGARLHRVFKTLDDRV